MSLLLRYNVRGLAVRSHEALMALGGMALASAVLVSVLALREGIASAFASAIPPSAMRASWLLTARPRTL